MVENESQKKYETEKRVKIDKGAVEKSEGAVLKKDERVEEKKNDEDKRKNDKSIGGTEKICEGEGKINGELALNLDNVVTSTVASTSQACEAN